MAQSTFGPIDIGRFRKIKLWPVPTSRGYYEIRYCDASRGYVTVKHSTGKKDWDEAQTYLATTFCPIARGEAADDPVAKPKPTVSALCDVWLDWAERNGRHKSNVKIVRRVCRVYGHLWPEQLPAGAALQQDYRKARGAISDWTVQRELGALRTVLNHAVDIKLIEPTEKPSFKKALPPQGPSRERYLDEDQEQWFWDQAMAWGARAQPPAAFQVMIFVAIAMTTAARHGAIMDLTWDRIDLKRRTIDFPAPGMRETKKRRVKGMPVNDDLLPVLLAAQARAHKDTSGRATGRVFSVASMRQPLATFTAAIGMEWVTAHVLRHSWASLNAMAGMPMATIAEIMGDTVATVSKYYLHLSPAHLHDAVNWRKRPALRAVS